MRRNSPAYIKNTELIEISDLYLSLGFTPEQVFDDYIADYFKKESFVRMLERRNELRLAKRFRVLAPRGWAAAAA